MTHYFSYLHHRSNNGVVAYGLGDWEQITSTTTNTTTTTTTTTTVTTPLGVTSTAMLYANSLALQQAARVVGKGEKEEEKYRMIAMEVKKGYREAFVHPGNKSQVGIGGRDLVVGVIIIKVMAAPAPVEVVVR